MCVFVYICVRFVCLICCRCKTRIYLWLFMISSFVYCENNIDQLSLTKTKMNKQID